MQKSVGCGVLPIDWNERKCAQGVEVYQSQILRYPIEEDPEMYARSQNNLGRMYQKLTKWRDMKEYSLLAIMAFKEAQKVYTLKDYPLEFNRNNGCRGVAYRTLATVDDKMKYCQLALDAFQAGIKGVDPEKNPIDYAIDIGNLGMIHRMMIEEDERKQHCQLAISYLKEALPIFIMERYTSQVYWVEHELEKVLKLCEDEESPL